MSTRCFKKSTEKYPQQILNSYFIEVFRVWYLVASYTSWNSISQSFHHIWSLFIGSVSIPNCQHCAPNTSLVPKLAIALQMAESVQQTNQATQPDPTQGKGKAENSWLRVEAWLLLSKSSCSYTSIWVTSNRTLNEPNIVLIQERNILQCEQSYTGKTSPGMWWSLQHWRFSRHNWRGY